MATTQKLIGQMISKQLSAEDGNDLLDLSISVQQKITCQCGHILDFHRSVVTRIGGRAVFVRCADCFDTLKEDMVGVAVNVAKESGIEGPVDFVDGRQWTKGLKRKAPPAKPAKPAKPKPRAFLNTGDNPQEVEYSKRFEGSGLTWFIHGKKKEWTVTQWECGLRLGVYDTQKQGIAAASNLTPEQVNIARGSISLHKINPPVKKGSK